MVVSFGDKTTEELFYGLRSSRTFRLSPDLVLRAKAKLDRVESAETINDLREPAGNRLKMLSGKSVGMWSIRVNDQWCIVFRWDGSDAHAVELVDYH